jgi:hypothetical protein
MKNKYGEVTPLQKDVVFEFPDFSLTYLGEEKRPVPEFVRGFFVYHNFKITNPESEQIVSWTTGAGLYGPKEFEVNGKKYFVILAGGGFVVDIDSNENWNKIKVIQQKYKET